MSNKAILVVDDSLSVRQEVSLILGEAGYRIVEASDGVEGVNCLALYGDIALVLCDLNMPRMNGLEFLSTIKGDRSELPVPVVMLTTQGAPELITHAKRAGAKGWIVKPFLRERLLAVVRRIAGDP